MASNVPTKAEQESDDLTTCCVCFEVFNERDRQPKFLTCHHTYCLSCIKVSTVNLTFFYSTTEAFFLLTENGSCHSSHLPQVQSC